MKEAAIQSKEEQFHDALHDHLVEHLPIHFKDLNIDPANGSGVIYKSLLNALGTFSPPNTIEVTDEMKKLLALKLLYGYQMFVELSSDEEYSDSDSYSDSSIELDKAIRVSDKKIVHKNLENFAFRKKRKIDHIKYHDRQYLRRFQQFSEPGRFRYFDLVNSKDGTRSFGEFLKLPKRLRDQTDALKHLKPLNYSNVITSESVLDPLAKHGYNIIKCALEKHFGADATNSFFPERNSLRQFAKYYEEPEEDQVTIPTIKEISFDNPPIKEISCDNPPIMETSFDNPPIMEISSDMVVNVCYETITELKNSDRDSNYWNSSFSDEDNCNENRSD